MCSKLSDQPEAVALRFTFFFTTFRAFGTGTTALMKILAQLLVCITQGKHPERSLAMKKKRNLLLMLLGVACMLPALLMAQQTGLKLTNASNEAMTVTINGQRYESTSPVLEINNLTPGNQFIRVSSVQTTGANGRIVPPRHLYSGWINLTQGGQTDARIDILNGLQILGINWPWQQGGNTNPNGQNPSYIPWPFPPGWPFPNLQMGMPEADYLRLKTTIDNQSFDSNKLAIAKQAAAANRMTAAQVAGLVRMLTFESSKLELAKAAYANCVDRNNYYLVNDAFTFSSSISELTNFTSGTGR